MSDLHVQHEDMIACRARARRLFLATAGMLVADTALVLVIDEPGRSLALIFLGWLLSGLWKYQRLVENITEQINQDK